MVAIKSYTDLEQSRKLAEILPLESADMLFNLGEDKYADSIRVPLTKEHWEQMIPDIKPCWSLAVLLSVLPDTITSNDGIAFKLNIKKGIIEYSNPSLYLIYKSVKADNLIDACYEMIIRLNELNLL